MSIGMITYPAADFGQSRMNRALPANPRPTHRLVGTIALSRNDPVSDRGRCTETGPLWRCKVGRQGGVDLVAGHSAVARCQRVRMPPVSRRCSPTTRPEGSVMRTGPRWCRRTRPSAGRRRAGRVARPRHPGPSHHRDRGSRLRAPGRCAGAWRAARDRRSAGRGGGTPARTAASVTAVADRRQQRAAAVDPRWPGHPPATRDGHAGRSSAAADRLAAGGGAGAGRVIAPPASVQRGRPRDRCPIPVSASRRSASDQTAARPHRQQPSRTVRSRSARASASCGASGRVRRAPSWPR
jgi:hypothetical protein